MSGLIQVERNTYGNISTHELIPGGSHMPVTKSNLLEYIHRLANYKLNIETSKQTKAFLSGFRVLIPMEWMKMFNPTELQLILSGEKSKINIRDLRGNVVYHGGYADNQPYIDQVCFVFIHGFVA